jgi:pimeloyl-ACP methyl ester carboxylesterase
MQAKKFMNSDYIGEYIEFDGKTMHYLKGGSGEPLILVHGIGQSLYTWREVFELLCENYTVFALDLIGMGYSSRPESYDYSVVSQAEAINGFMDAMQISSAHMLAFSTGTLYALQFTQQHPEKVGGLMLISPGGLTPEMPFIVPMLSSSLIGSIAAKLFTVKTVRKLLDCCFFDHTLLTEEAVREYYMPLTGTPARLALHYSLRGLADEEIMQSLRYIKNNTLIILGEDDKWHTKELAEVFHNAILESQFAIVRNCGHMVQEEKPQRLIELINEFIFSKPETAQEEV